MIGGIKIIYSINNPLPAIILAIIGAVLIIVFVYILKKYLFSSSDIKKNKYHKLIELSILLIVYILITINVVAEFYTVDNKSCYCIVKIGNVEYYQDLKNKIVYSESNNNKTLVMKNAINSTYYNKFIYYMSNGYIYKKYIYNLKSKPKKIVKGNLIYFSNCNLVYETNNSQFIYEFNMNNNISRPLINFNDINLYYDGGFKGEWVYFIDKKGYVERKNINSLKVQIKISKYPTKELYVSKYAVIYRVKNSALLYKINDDLGNVLVGKNFGLFQTDEDYLYYINQESRFLCKKEYSNNKEIRIIKIPNYLTESYMANQYGYTEYSFEKQLIDPNRVYFSGVDYRAKKAFYYSVRKNGGKIIIESERWLKDK